MIIFSQSESFQIDNGMTLGDEYRFHSNVHEDVRFKDTISPLERLVPLHSSTTKGLQIEYNAPLNTFSPVVEENPASFDVNVHDESMKTTQHTQAVLDSKVDKLKYFREHLCKRVVDRTKTQRHRLADHEHLFLETQERLLRYAIVEKPAPKAAGQTERVSETTKAWTGMLVTDPALRSAEVHVSNKKKPLGTRVQELKRTNHSIRTSLLKCVTKLSFEQQSDDFSDTSDLNASTTQKKRIADMEHVLFTPRERAQLFAAVRRSYMEVERNRIKSRSKTKTATAKPEHRDIGESIAPSSMQTGRPRREFPFVINVTEGKNVAITEPVPRMKEATTTSSDLRSPTARKSISKATEKDGERYLAALQRLDSSPAICSCIGKCANNCSLYKNPRQAKKLVLSSMFH